ncbi:MAG: glycosyltransferase family 2 protein [Ignavibacteria bacterium]|nr:glycosyltransferase family 2 protein [Ignavibacteria bacterium]
MISVIIPTYNRAQLLRLTIESILLQTAEEIEILIIDDGSTDDTEKVVKEFKHDNIKYFKLSNTGNIGRLRNFGIQRSTYDILAFCDDDDIWEKEKLSRQLSYLDKYDFVCSNGKLVDSGK